jgi:three-Cys-motif partner protein
MDADDCPCGKTSHSEPIYKGKNGNCLKRQAPDGLPVQCVGAWSQDKHDYIQRYIDATRGPRAKYLPPKGSGGAAFVDLFAGPGLACVPGKKDPIEGSPLIAMNHTGAPFTKIVLCEIDEENVRTLERRTASAGTRISIVPGDCNARIDDIVRLLPPHGLNIALVDPFSPSTLLWETLRILGMVNRMDFIIHFPTGPIKRNFNKPGYHDTIDRMVGTREWRSVVKSSEDVPKLIDSLRGSLASIGYTGDRVRSLPVENSKDNVLYHLVFAAKHGLGNKIWQSVARTTPRGDRELDFGV